MLTDPVENFTMRLRIDKPGGYSLANVLSSRNVPPASTFVKPGFRMSFTLTSQRLENHLGYDYFPGIAPNRVMKGFVSILFAPAKDGGNFSSDKG